MMYDITLNLSKNNQISGGCVGCAASEGEFYKNARTAIRYGSIYDYRSMMSKKSPSLKLLGAWCLAKNDLVKYTPEIKTLLMNSDTVTYLPGGCGASQKTVAELTEKILESPDTMIFYK